MLDSIVEKKIAEAIERGELDDLPGAGQPLAQGEASAEEQSRALRKLALLKLRVEGPYYRKAIGKLGR